MNPGRLLKVMGFMISVSGNMKIIMSGKCSLICLITSHLPQSSTAKSSVLMAVCPHHSPLSTTSVNSIDSNKSHTKAPSVIFSGVIQIKDLVSTSVPEELAGLSVK